MHKFIKDLQNKMGDNTLDALLFNILLFGSIMFISLSVFYLISYTGTKLIGLVFTLLFVVSIIRAIYLLIVKK